MAEMSDKYKGIELFGIDGEKVGTVSGLLVDESRRQYYVVDAGGSLGLGRTRYYVPAELGVATGSQRLEIELNGDQIAEMGWDRAPAAWPPGAG